MTQREPTHPMLRATLEIRDMALKYIQNFETEGTLAAWPYWKSPSARWEDIQEMEKLFGELIAMTDREKELTITASTMKEGLIAMDYSGSAARLLNLSIKPHS